MKTIAVACRTIADEILLAADQVKSVYPIIWVDSRLHNFPDKLKERIQTEIDKIDNVENILLLFGYCGNSILGLVSRKARLIFPRVDDCIALLLGGNERKNQISRKSAAYFLTPGWLRYENNIWSEFCHSVQKYGYERARGIMRVLLHNYRKLNIIDTSVYDLEKFLEETEKIASELGLEQGVVKGSLDILHKALTGEWDEGFAVVEPGRAVELTHVGIIPNSLMDYRDNANDPLSGG